MCWGLSVVFNTTQSTSQKDLRIHPWSRFHTKETQRTFRCFRISWKWLHSDTRIQYLGCKNRPVKLGFFPQPLNVLWRLLKFGSKPSSLCRQETKTVNDKMIQWATNSTVKWLKRWMINDCITDCWMMWANDWMIPLATMKGYDDWVTAWYDSG